MLDVSEITLAAPAWRRRSRAKGPLACLLILPLVLALAACGGSSSSFSIPTTGTPDQRADAVLAKMTQDEKLAMVQGGVTTNLEWGYTIPLGAAGWVPGIPRLSIPALYLADGSVGVGNAVGPATALPSSIASAASWDLNEATKYGTVIGTELADYGINVNLGGNTNLIGREPRDGHAGHARCGCFPAAEHDTGCPRPQPDFRSRHCYSGSAGAS